MGTFVWLWAAMTSGALAQPPAWDVISDADGWKELATRKSDYGEVQVYVKEINSLACLQGILTADADVSRLLEVVTDIDSAVTWSSADLTDSKLLRRGPGTIDFYQYLDVPNWTLVADRYWFLRAEWESEDRGARFRWTRLDPDSTYADRRAEILDYNDRAVEPPINWGEWVFSNEGPTTEVRYRACADIGGVIPQSIQRWVATRTLPDTVADVVREAIRRQGT
jgi:hypothetical protein